MQSADHWLRKYGESEEPATLLRWLCVPAIVVGLVGLLWSLPVPEAFRASSTALNWGTVFLSAALVYYFMISIPLAFGSLPFIVGILVTLTTPSYMVPMFTTTLGLIWLGIAAFLMTIGVWIMAKMVSFDF